MIETLLLVLAALQDPPEPARERPRAVRSSVRIIIEDSPEGDYEHDYYEQSRPVEYRSGATDSRAALESRIWLKTACRPQDEDRRPTFLPAPPPDLPLTISGTITIPELTVKTNKITWIPRIDPIITKTAAKSAASGSDSDTRLMAGPDFDLQVVSRLSGWGFLGWMPDQTSLHLFARALFGSFEVFGVSTDLQMYGLGPRLVVPILSGDALDLSISVSAGPAFLHTGIGDALGFDGGVGLRLQRIFTPAVTFIASVEANLYTSRNVTCFGPVFNLGFNVSW